MKYITKYSLAKDARNRWKAQYEHTINKPERSCGGFDRTAIYNRLIPLSDNPTPEEVDDAIGNTSWTSIKCDECGEYVDAAVEVGEEQDYTSATAMICGDCLKEAYHKTIKDGKE